MYIKKEYHACKKKILLSNVGPLLLSDLCILPSRDPFPWDMSPYRVHVGKKVRKNNLDQELIEYIKKPNSYHQYEREVPDYLYP